MGRTVSGLLDDLLAKVPDASYALDELTGTQAYEWALNDVREVLLSDQTVERLSHVAGSAAAREFLAVLAGEDHE